MTKLPDTPIDDPYRGRQPTTHERQAGQPWDDSYRHGPAPWDIGRPQPVVVRLAAEGAFTGAVLDAGCGTGENSLHLAALGLSVLGLDVAETALNLAREKACHRRIPVEFAYADALHLERLGRTFDTVLDSALFHAFEHDEHVAYVAGLHSVTRPGSNVYVLCFSDQGPDLGPHPVSKGEFVEVFQKERGWAIESIEPASLETRFHPNGASAWLAAIKRL